MNRLIKFYNQNRHLVWLIILIIIAIIALIQILNKFASKQTSTENTTSQNTISYTTVDNNYSVITGKEVKEETSEIIDEFINYCNEEEVEKAYALLSDDCKEVFYPTVDDFIEKYYSKLFSDKKTYSYQAWITNNNSYTYKVDFTENMLATGKTSDTSIIDYYTVVKNDENYELNINKFIGIEDIEKTVIQNNITINVIRKRIYMDYEIYEFEVKNKSGEDMMLDSLQQTNSVYLVDNNELKYYWYAHEIIEEDITIESSRSKEVEIKFSKEYRAGSEAEKIVFPNVSLNEQILEIEIILK